MHETPPALVKIFAKWQIKDELTAKYFASAMLGLVAVSAVIHWSAVVLRKHRKRQGLFKSTSRPVQLALRRLLSPRMLWGVTISPGHGIIILIYWAINIALTLYDSPQRVGNAIVAKRLGWMALLNMSLAVFLGLKNTPLSPLAGKTYQDLNILHRCCGYTTVIYAVLHASIYVHTLIVADAFYVLEEHAQYARAVAGMAMVIIALTANRFFRKRQYEIFYVIHVVFVAVLLVAVGLHRPDLSLQAAIITIFTASIWAADRTWRLSSFLARGLGNHCTLTPVANGATKVTLHQKLKRARPGSHAFLWIPTVRGTEAHPFTLVSTDPVQFLVKGRDGFTKDLYKRACSSLGSKFRASLDGPYGNVPDLQDGYDKIILVAGGSGVTFTLGLAMQYIRDAHLHDDLITLDFIWVARDYATLAWFDDEMSELRGHPKANTFLYVSGDATNSTSTVSGSQQCEIDQDDSMVEKGGEHIDVAGKSIKSSKESARPSSELRAERGRPDLNNLIERALSAVAGDSRVLIAGCGPSPLMADLNAIVNLLTQTSRSPTIELFLEQFSY